MPQHLRIEVEDEPMARLTTYNKGNTVYDITLCVPETCTDILLSDVDTKVPRQPQDDEGRKKDYRDDFKHARRCVAAAFTSSDRLLRHLRANRLSGHAKMKPIMMRLMTNKNDRGLIQALPMEDDSFHVTVIIGAGKNRVSDSLPEAEWQWTCEGISVSGAVSHTERALMIVRAIGESLQDELERHETV
jgi:hypothetical protein